MSAEAASLVARATAFACDPRTGSAIDERAGVAATVDCDTGAGDIDRLTLRSFEDADALKEWWQTRSAATSSLDFTDNACSKGTGARKWGFGTVACLRQDGTTQVRWTDSRIDLLGVVESADNDIPDLYQWWRDNARRLGRDTEDSTELEATPNAEATPTAEASPKATPTPKATPKPKTGPLVRVPGKPRAATCSGSIFTEPDEWDRTWRVNKVKVENKDGYERVILTLLRTGKNRSKIDTEARAQRMDVTDVPKAVSSASRPGLGRIAFVVELDGITDAPNIRGYRPTGVNLVKEISLVKRGKGRALVVSAPLGTCYQMRIPVWGANATGKEQRAEIFIDLKDL